MSRPPQFKTLQLLEGPAGCLHLQLARPSKSNAMIADMWEELPQAFQWLQDLPDCRVVILSGQGRNFCAGIDLQTAASTMQSSDGCPGRAALQSRHAVLRWQASLTAIETCRWPVIAAIQGACMGAGIDMVSCCDIRFCSQSVSFCIKEVDLAIVADMGTLQRLPHIIGHGATSELALTARRFGADEALALGLVSKVLPDDAALTQHVERVAAQIAAKSPLAITGTKRVLLHARDHPVQEGLEYVAAWNGSQLASADLQEAFKAMREKRQPVFAKL